MAHRHKKAHGGKVMDAYGNPNVEKEAKESKDKPGAIQKKAGGRVPGRKSGGRVDKFARGGRAHNAGAHGTHTHLSSSKTGADHSPFSSAHVKSVVAGGNPPPHGHSGE
jgi:hypothetical protein